MPFNKHSRSVHRHPLSVASPDRWEDSANVLANFIDPANRVARCCKTPTVLQHMQEHVMRKFHSIAALCGDGLRPELQALFDRLDIDPSSELFVRDDGMHQAGPDPASERAFTAVVPLTKRSG
jgi:hypothetical protein